MSAIFTILPVVISLVALAISALSYNSSRNKTVQMNRKITQVRVLVSNLIVLWTQIQIITSAQLSKMPIDNYVFPSVRRNAGIVIESIKASVGAGAYELLTDGGPHSLELYAAFLQGLDYVSRLPDDAKLEEWTKQHFLMGLVRSLDVFLDFPGVDLPHAIKERIRKEISPVLEYSRSYLNILTPTA